ncbi:hypothetical protein ACLKA6_011302 [Drosophila palustris]
MITKGRERQQRGGKDKDRLMLTISAETDEVNNDAGDDEPYYVTLSLPRSRASSSEPRVINVARHQLQQLQPGGNTCCQRVALICDLPKLPPLPPLQPQAATLVLALNSDANASRMWHATGLVCTANN